MPCILKSNNPKGQYQVHTDADYDGLKRKLAKAMSKLAKANAKIKRLESKIQGMLDGLRI